MNIIILQGAFFPIPPVLGGAVEKMWFKLGREFSRLGHRVTHISRQYPGFPDGQMIDGVTYVRVPGFAAPKYMFKHKFLDAIYSWKAVKAVPAGADVVITNSFWAPIFLQANRNYVIYVDVARMPKGQMRLYSKADCLRANSYAVVEAIKAELPVAQHYRIGMVPNPLPFDVSDQLNLSLKQPVILFCGRVHAEKGLELLAQALNGVDLKDWKVQIVGPWDIAQGGSGNDYKNHLIKCFGSCKVEFLGPIFDETKLNEIYRNSSVFVYPSLAEKGETFGLAPLEAMAWGAVPIVSDLTCFKDFITHEKNGIVFNHRSKSAVKNLSEAIQLLIGNMETRNVLAYEAIRVRETHSTAHIARQFGTDFEQLLNMKRCKA